MSRNSLNTSRMVTTKIQELRELEKKLSFLKSTNETERVKELRALPAQYGFDSVDDFVKAVKASAGAKPAKASKAGRPKAAKAAKPGKRKRAKITDEIKQQVKAGVEAGKSGAAIAGELGISLPSVQNIKKELGLVKARA